MYGRIQRNANALYARRSNVRAVIYSGIGVGILATFISTLGQHGTSVSQWLVPAASFAAIALFAEALIFLSRPKASSIFAGNQIGLLHDLPSLHSLIDSSDSILILGGTLKTFTDDSENLSALARHFAQNRPLRILAMHPDSQAIVSTARARAARSRSDTPASLASEVETSLARLTHALGDGALRHIALYKEHPTFSLYKLGDQCLLTVYTIGRGASSPAIWFTESEDRKQFVKSLCRGFDELWSAKSTQLAENHMYNRARGSDAQQTAPAVQQFAHS